MASVFRHSRCESWAPPSTCTGTRSIHGGQPITGDRPSYGGRPLAKSGRDVRGGLYTFRKTSWILTCLIVSLPLCFTYSETFQRTFPQSADEEASIGDHDCTNPTMVHMESLQVHQIQDLLDASHRLWVFGYGSLVWKTGFSYTSHQIGYIDGFVRRFWQGDTTHRGTMESPGRVATLEKDKSGQVWGVAFELVGRQQIEVALEHLGMRECLLGGYSMHKVPFHYEVNNNNTSDAETTTIDTLLFVASPDNRNYLGRASIGALSDQIVTSRGKAGHNVEYVIRLADFMRESVPDGRGIDAHLEELDCHLRQNLLDRDIDLEELLSMETDGYGYMYNGNVTGRRASVDSSHSEEVQDEGTDTEGVVTTETQEEAVVHDKGVQVTSQTLIDDSGIGRLEGGRLSNSNDNNAVERVDQNCNMVKVVVSTTPTAKRDSVVHNPLSIDSTSSSPKREAVTVVVTAKSTKKSKRNKSRKQRKIRNNAPKEL